MTRKQFAALFAFPFAVLAAVAPASALDMRFSPTPGNTPGSLKDDTLGINRADGRLFWKRPDGSPGVGTLLNALPSGRRAVEQGQADDLSVTATGGNTAIASAERAGRRLTFRDVGCPPTGLTDCTALVQRALNTMSAAGGGTLYGDPREFYQIGSNLTVPTNTGIDLGVAQAGLSANGVWGLNPSNVFGLGKGPGGTILLAPTATITLAASGKLQNGYIINRDLPTPKTLAETLANVAGYAGTALQPNGSQVHLTNLTVIGFNKAIYAPSKDGRLTVRDIWCDSTNCLEIANSLDLDHVHRLFANSFYTQNLATRFPDGYPLDLTVREGTFVSNHDGINGFACIDCFTYGHRTGFDIARAYTTTLIGGGAEFPARGNGYTSTQTSYGLKTSGKGSVSWFSGAIAGHTFPRYLMGTGGHSFTNMHSGANGSTANFVVAGPGTFGTDIGSSYNGGVGSNLPDGTVMPQQAAVAIQAGALGWTFANGIFNGQTTVPPFDVDVSAKANFAAYANQTVSGTRQDTLPNYFAAQATAANGTVAQFFGNVSGTGTPSTLKIGNLNSVGKSKNALAFVARDGAIVDSIESYSTGDSGLIFRLVGGAANVTRFTLFCASTTVCEWQNAAGQTFSMGSTSAPMGSWIGAGAMQTGLRTVSTSTGAPDTMLATDSTIVVNKSASSPTAVTALACSSTYKGRTIVVQDGKGDAATNNITITPASGTINGTLSKVINTAYGFARMQCDGGTNWLVQ
ncbi:hypothetical protein ACSD7O_24720 [Methylorubrum extorquens]|uniref:hypothetical protein n=1 Tax=Methylorubrum extorquens TaxID=408 RepID=UPI003F5E9912